MSRAATKAVNLRFQELDSQRTPMGDLSLRMRTSAAAGGARVYEVSLDGEFLMSSLVNDSERALATLAMDRIGGRPTDVLVGGLGLGYTAAAALSYEAVRSVRVVEFLEPVIQWHYDRLVPAAGTLLDDARCEILHADFFEHVRENLPRWHPGRYDAILLDIDHSPESLLNAHHAAFYTEGSLRLMAQHLRVGGVFALWTADSPSPEFLELVGEVFEDVQTHAVEFHNPLHDRNDTNVVVLARRGAAAIPD